MKTSLTKINLLSAAFLLVFSASAMALPTAGQTVRLYDGPGNTGGGEFRIDIVENGKGIDYKSFCLEFTEYITLSTSNNSTTYTIGSVEEYANSGGGSDTKSDKKGAIKEDGEWRDYLDSRTKWVFWNYITGELGTQGEILANKVQKIIWVLENEKSVNDFSDYNDFYTELIGNRTDFTINGVVKVLNLYKDNTLAQSQIIGEPIPEPATMLLFGTGIAGLAGMVRRRRMHN